MINKTSIISGYIIFMFFHISHAQTVSPAQGPNGNTPIIKIEYGSGKDLVNGESWIRDKQWLWAPSYEYNLLATPVLRLVFEPDFDFKVLSMDVDIRLIHEEIDRSTGKNIKKAMIDIPFYYKEAKLKIREKGKEPAEIKISLTNEDNKHLTLIHDSCAKLGLSFPQSLPTNTQAPNVALTCLRDAQQLYVNIQHQVGWSVTSKENPDWVSEGKFRSIGKIKMEGREQPKDGILFQFIVKDKMKQELLNYVVKTDGKIFPRYDLKIGGGVTAVKFEEPKTAVNFESMLLKIFLEGSYDFRTSPYIADGDISFTPFSIYSTQGVQRRATFTEYSIGISRKLFAQEREWYSVGLGWFFWGMLVTPAGWGVDYLAGPRLTAAYHKDVYDQPEYIIRGSLAFLHADSGIDTASRILDGEIYYEISTPGVTNPIFLHAEIEHTEYKIRSMNREILATSLSLGAATTF